MEMVLRICGPALVLLLAGLAASLWGIAGLGDGLAASAKAIGLEGYGGALGWAGVAAVIALSALNVVKPALGARLTGLAVVLAMGWLVYETYDKYRQLANVARWSGQQDLNWLRPWLTEFRMPLLCVAAFLGLTGLSWAWSKLRLGH